MKEPLVSIVITTKNEEKHIENCLLSIKNQSYENIEIIVVDNQSTDKTKDIAFKYTKKVFDKGPERSAQRNYGMLEKSKGDYVMFVDADMILSAGLVKSCVNEMQNSDFIALHIPEIVLGKKFFSKVRCFERSFYNGTVIDGARFFLKKEFVKVNGFDETMSGPEDWDIDKKIKQAGDIGLLQISEFEKMSDYLYDLIYTKGINPQKYGSVIFHNEAEFDLTAYLRKKGYYAKSFDTYINKWGKDDPEIKKQFGLWYRFFGVFIENGKWQRLIMHPVLTFGLYFLRFLVGFFYLFRIK